MKPDAVMIFAAGLGTRMGHLTQNCPKPLIEVGGRPLLSYALDIARKAGTSRIVVNIHAHADMMRRYLKEHAPDVLISHETELLETGGGLRHALQLLGNGPVFTLNSDMVWHGANPLTTLKDAWDGESADALLAVVPVASALGHTGKGDFFVAADGAISRRGQADHADYVYSGAQIICPNLLQSIDEAAFSLNLAWDRGLPQGRIKGIIHPGRWIDVGRPEGIRVAEDLLRQ